MKCREELGLKVIAVFYKVDPSHVKKLAGDFGKVFKKTYKGKKTEKIETWREAFAKVATIAGYDSSQWNNEAEMIEKIAGEISKMLCHSTPSRDFDGLIGMGAHMEKIEELLCSESDEVRMIGIWGPSGIGKTTIARFLFSKHSQDFNLSAFMENVKGYTRQVCSDDYPLKLHMHQQLMSHLFNQKDIEISHLGVAQDRLQDKKVLVVLDDVDRSVQLDAMAKDIRWFGPGSRIVITTQDTRLLMKQGIERIYKVDFPTTEEALRIFCMNAFNQNFPKDGFEKLAQEVTYLAGNLPLGLKIMGSYFKNMCKQDWIEALPKLMTHLDSDIQSILKFSYDALDAQDQDLFLHIACFFEFLETPETVEMYLEKNFSDVRHGIRVLTEKSLISINEYGRLEMHNLLVQLGREIVREQSICNPGQHRLMLVNAQETCEVVTDDAASRRRVLGIHFCINETEKKLNISKKAFNGFSNLQFLRFTHSNKVHTPSGLNNLPRRLRFLKWPFYPFRSLPSEFHTEFLVKLDLQHSELEKLWEGMKPLNNLVWMNLSWSINLKELPNLSTATSLQELNLSYCSSLVKLPSSIGNATSLVTLDLNYCSELVELPSTFGNFQKLSKLIMRECSKIEALPTNINLESLKELDLSGCSMLKVLPQISSNIEDLNLRGTAIKEVTSSIMPRLAKLNMSNCEKFKEFPHAFASITLLILIDKETQELPAWFKRFSCLRELYLFICIKLVRLLHLPDSLQCLFASDCKSLETVYWSSHNSKFSRLDFSKCFKLNKEARELIIQTSTSDYAILPGIEVPTYFTHRAIGDSVTVNLKGRPFPTPIRFKVCILLAEKALVYYKGVAQVNYKGVSLQIMDKHNGLTVMITKEDTIFVGQHLSIFEDEAEIEVTSRELVFEFKIHGRQAGDSLECGVKLQLMEDDERDQELKQ